VLTLVREHQQLLEMQSESKQQQQGESDVERDNGDEVRGMLKEACLVLRGVCVGDDLRRDFSSAHDSSREVVAKGGVEAITFLARTTLDSIENTPTNNPQSDSKVDCEGEDSIPLNSDFIGTIELLSASFLCLKQLASTDENVHEIVREGGLDMAQRALIIAIQQQLLTLGRSSVALLRNMAASDRYKDDLAESGVGGQVAELMTMFGEDGGMMEHSLALFAQLALRSPHNSRILSQEGVLSVSIGAMRKFRERVSLQVFVSYCFNFVTLFDLMDNRDKGV